MRWCVTFFRSALVAWAALALTGCVPASQSQSEEEKEPHFMAGKNRVSTLDYKGAIESFEKALEVNPRSAAAHFELACLFDRKEADPAAAIYHYESYLKLRPEAGNADVVKQRVMTCKQELARNVSLGPLTERQQREFEQLTEENKRLSDELKRVSDDLDKWRAYAARLQGLTNQPVAAPGPRRSTPAPVAPAASPVLIAVMSNPVTHSRSNAVLVVARTHTVKAGETPTQIAKKYGLRVDALLEANPGIDARRLRIGQALTLPAS